MAFPGARKFINTRGLTLLTILMATAAIATAGMSSGTYRIDRSAASNGSNTPTGGVTYRALPHIISAGASGHSLSANYRINHGPLGGILRSGDQIYVDPMWLAQGDVDSDPTVGPTGCNPAPISLVLGVNAFNSITNGVLAVNPGGTVYVMNGLYQEENILVAKPMVITGFDESTSGCLGLPGQIGAIVEPATPVLGGKPLFQVASSDVTIRNMTLEGDSATFAGAFEANYGVELTDATGTINNLALQNLIVRNFPDHGAYLLAPQTTGHLIRDCDFQILGDYLPGGSIDGGAILFGGASGTVDGGAVTMATSGVSILGGDTIGMPPLSGSGAIPNVDVSSVAFLSVGSAGANGAGAIAYLNNATGSADSNTLMGIHRGIQVGSMITTGTITLSRNDLSGPAFVGLDIHSLRAPTNISPPSIVEASSNTLSGIMDGAAIAVRYIGRDTTGPTAPAEVTLSGNTLSSIATTGPTARGIFLSGMGGQFGQVTVENNTIAATPTLAAGVGISLHTTDQVFASGTDNDTVNVEIQGNTVSDWPTGIAANSLDIGVLPGAPVETRIGGSASNAVTGSNIGILADGQAATIEVLGNMAISNNGIGIWATGGSLADVQDNRLENNSSMALQADANSLVNFAGNEVTIPAAPATGILVDNAAGVDMGGGLFGSPGSNTFDVAGLASAVQLIAFAPGTVRAENNTWQHEGATYNAGVAIDDLIFDGDLDNPLAEGPTAGPLDFHPFNPGALQSPIVVDATAQRGDPGYGTTRFRTLSDGIEAVASGGSIDLATGNYLSLRYDANSVYQVASLPVDRPMSILGDAPGGPIVYPAGNDVGTTSTLVTDGTALTLLDIRSDNVSLTNVVFDGDNPAIPGGSPQNGADVNARNAIVVDQTIGDGPDSLLFESLQVRNFFFKGIATDGIPAGPSDSIAINASLFSNITGQGDEAGAIALGTLANSSVTSNTIGLVSLAIAVTPNDTTSTHTIASNALADIANLGINAAAISNNARFDISGNTVAMGPTANKAIAVEGVTAAAQALVSGNTVQSGSGILLAVQDVDADALLLAQSNDLLSTSGLTIGVLAEATDRLTTATTGLQLVLNQISNHTTGVEVAGAISPATNTGTVLRRNALDGNATGVRLVAATGQTEVLVGGDTIDETNVFTNSGTGVFLSGPAANATIINQYTPFDTQDYGVWAEGGAQTIVTASRFDNSSSAAIALTDPGTEALIENNRLAGDTNQIGVLIDNGALASMGPGNPANDISGAYFAGAQSAGSNRFWFYTGAGGHFAIHNLSALDQNAENNDFGTTDLVTVEDMVEHQPDNGQGLVLFVPPMAPFTTIDDWSILQME